MATKPIALITGVSGQDGAYLAKSMLNRGFRVIGTTRNDKFSDLSRLSKLEIIDLIDLYTVDLSNPLEVEKLINTTSPQVIFHFSSQSSVGKSFQLPRESIHSTVVNTLNLLETLRISNYRGRFFFAGSGECFGDTSSQPAHEDTPLRPLSPYGVGKASAQQLVATYRNAYGLQACTGILFNHESPLRGQDFVTQKIVTQAAKIAKGSLDMLYLGNLSVHRDWGWAPEYVEAIIDMTLEATPQDLVLATGRTESLEKFVEITFAFHNLNWKNYVRYDDNLYRIADIPIMRANPELAKKIIGWEAKVTIETLIEKLCASCNKIQFL